MSKVDAQRAMRDARYAAYRASRESEGDPVAAAPVTAPTSRTRPTSQVSQADGVETLCGHRSIGNKSCTRPSGHPEESHRYS